MYETPDDLMRLQRLLDHSIEQAGSFLRSSFQMPDHSLGAAQLISYWNDFNTVALATVTARGEPRVAPISALMYRAQVYVPTVANATRAKHLRSRPAVSLTHYNGNDVAIIAHGSAAILQSDQPLFAELDQIQRDLTGQSVLGWGDGVYLRVDAAVMYTYVRYPDQFRGTPQAR